MPRTDVFPPGDRLQPGSLPAALRPMLPPGTGTRVTVGWSGTDLYRFGDHASEARYLKSRRSDAFLELRAEWDRLVWLDRRLPAPEALAYLEESGREYLLLSGVPAVDASSQAYANGLPSLVSELARGLRRIHSLPTADCPFDHRVEARLREAGLRMDAGLVDPDDFDPERQGRSPQELFDELLSTRPVHEDLAFTHGDYCLPNVLLAGGRVTGFVDWGRAGVADRYQDLALAARSLVYNFGPEHVPWLFAEYGIGEPDHARLEFYRLLDEFF